MENCEVTSVLEYIDFLHATLGRLSIEEIDYSDYCQMTDYLDEIEKQVKRLEKKQEPMKPVYDDETYDNFGETFYEYTCPLCEAYIEVSGIMGYQPNYCDNCGQKLDWED